MDIQLINNELLSALHEQAKASERLRMNFDLRTTPEDTSQRMLNALLPGTEVPIHRHPNSNEDVLLITGKMYEILYEEEPLVNGEGLMVHGSRLREKERLYLCPAEGRYGCQVPKGVWHTVEVLEPSVIYEAKDGKYGEDGSEMYDV